MSDVFDPRQGKRPPVTSADSPFSAVLLAAGEGARLGRVPKSLLRLDGVSLIEGQVRALLDAGAAKIIIVTGYFYLEIEGELEKIMSQSGAEIRSRLLIVRNPAPEKGQQSSVLLGLGASYHHRDGEGDANRGDKDNQHPTLIALVDQPLMRAADYQSCVQAFHQRPSGRSIVYPVVGGQRGNPVAFSADSVHNVLQSGLTCREYIDHHRDQVYRFATDNDHFIVDIDQEQDRLRLEARTGLTLSLPPA